MKATNRDFGFRLEVLVAASMFVLVNVASAVFQPQISVNDGKGWDGAAYYAVAEEIVEGQTPAAESPFVYRVGTPFLTALLFKNDLTLGFKAVNLLADALITLLLVVWLRRFLGDWRIRLGLVTAFLLQWHGPVRFLHFYPIATDHMFIAALLCGLLAIYSARLRLTWMLVAGVSLITVLGVTVRESGLLLGIVAPFAQNPIRLRLTQLRPAIWLVIPFVLGAAAFAAIHAVVTTTNTVASGASSAWLVPKSPAAYLLGWWTAFGPLLVLPIFTWRPTLKFLREHQFMAVLLGILAILSSISSPRLQLELQDTERYLFWAMPVLYVLIGLALEETLQLFTRPLLGLLIGGQMLAERAVWMIPQPGATDPSELFARSSSAVLLLTPLGKTVEYFDLFPSWMSQSYRFILLGEYFLLALVVIAALYWRSRSRLPTRAAAATAI
jgi:hypothetical protein